ncbi:MAG: DUF2723 domain-containing protein [Planctomycetota bacterium]|nr:DUF2723 domain-containing protein [Planctomycetota bacterium]
MFQWRVLTGDYTGRLGLALAHPLYIAAGRLLGLLSQRDLPFLLNFFSSLGMAVALANLAAVTTLLTGRRWIGLATAAMLAVTHAAWWLSVIAEVYTWSAAGLTAELWLLVLLLRRPSWQKLAGLALVNGLGLCVHNFALLPLLVYVIVAVVLVASRRLPARSLAAAAGGYCLGAGLFMIMTIDLAVRTADSAGAVSSALFGNYARQVLNITETSKNLKANAALAALSFANLLGPLAVIGWVRMRRRLGGVPAATIGAITLIELLFVVRYPVPDQFTFLLPTLVMVSLAVAIGLAVLADAGRRWRIAAVAACLLSITLPPVFYCTAPTLACWAGVEIKRARKLPFRNEMRYWIVPWKHNEQSAELFARAACQEAKPDGVILADSTSVYPLLIVQRRDQSARGASVQFRGRPLPLYRKDPRAFRQALAGRQLYAVSTSYLPDELLRDAKFTRHENQVLYRAAWELAPQVTTAPR